MEQNFDASNILSKLRNTRSCQSTSPSATTVTEGPTLGRESSFSSGNYQSRRNRFQRKERPEVRIELENEIDILTAQVAHLIQDNKQLRLEKDQMEFRCADIKDKADVTISKLRNKLVALERKKSETNTRSAKDNYATRKNMYKAYSKGAGVLNITNTQPTTISHLKPGSSIQSLTFSQYMKINSQDAEDDCTTSLRHHNQHNEGCAGVNEHDSAPNILSSSLDLQQESGSVESQYTSGLSAPQQQRQPARSRSLAPQTRVVLPSYSLDLSQRLDDFDPTEDGSSMYGSDINHNGREHDDEDLPVVSIDLRVA